MKCLGDGPRVRHHEQGCSIRRGFRPDGHHESGHNEFLQRDTRLSGSRRKNILDATILTNQDLSWSTAL